MILNEELKKQPEKFSLLIAITHLLAEKHSCQGRSYSDCHCFVIRNL